MVWMNHRTFGEWVKEKALELVVLGVVGYAVGTYHANQRHSDALEMSSGMQDARNYQILYSVSNDQAYPHLVYMPVTFPINADDVSKSIDKLVKENVRE